MMGLLDQLGGLPGMLGQIGAGAATAASASLGGGPQRHRRQRPDYRPQDIAQMELLQKYLGMGLDPGLAMSEMEGIEGGLQERIANFQAKNAERRAMMQSVLPSALGTAAEMQAAGIPQAAVETAFSGYGGKVGDRVDQLVGDLYSGAGAAAAIPDEERQGAWAEATELAAAGVPLHTARMQMMAKGRDLLGLDGAAEQELYDLIGSAYSAAVPAGGGLRATMLNAPLAGGQPGAGGAPVPLAGLSGTAATGVGGGILPNLPIAMPMSYRG
jgi:hypothetical protein